MTNFPAVQFKIVLMSNLNITLEEQVNGAGGVTALRVSEGSRSQAQPESTRPPSGTVLRIP